MVRDMNEVDEFRRTVLARQAEAEAAFVRGDPGPRNDMWSRRDPLTLFGAMGMFESGWESLGETFSWVASRFSNVSDYRFEVLAADVVGDMAYAIAYERFNGSVNGRPIEPITLRTTHIYRREQGEWKIVHRHGDNPPVDPAGVDRSANAHREETVPGAAVSVVRRPGEGRSVPNPIAGDVFIKLTEGETGGALSLFESAPRPGEGPPMHVHPNEDELLYVLEGTIRFKLGDEQMRETAAGGIAFIPRGLPHAWQNVGSEPARLVFLFTPASPGMERFFPAFAEVPEGGPVGDEFARLGREAGMEVVGPPLAQTHPDPPRRGSAGMAAGAVSR